ncbi:MAG: hypothetical protein ACRDKZ_06130, partial [Actinomycetota bacterium]
MTIDHDESSADRDNSAELSSDVGESEVEPTERTMAQPDQDEVEATPEQVAEIGNEFVTGVLEAMGMEADVSTRLEGERVVVDVTGDDLGVLIGRRGQTL